MQVLRGVEDQKAFDKGLNNSTTARGAARCCSRSSATGRPSSARADAEMVAILKRQKFNDGDPRRAAGRHARRAQDRQHHRIHHDAAIVFGPRPYVLVVLVRGIQEEKQSAALMAGFKGLVQALNYLKNDTKFTTGNTRARQHQAAPLTPGRPKDDRR